jgi:hypothetical protein
VPGNLMGAVLQMFMWARSIISQAPDVRMLMMNGRSWRFG